MASKAKEKLYEVDKIVGDKVTNGTRYYKIHWKGFGSNEDTWEPESSLVNCSSLVQQYKRKSLSPDKRGYSSNRFKLDNPATPVRESRSLTKRTTTITTSSSSRVVETPPSNYSPSRYNFRKSTVAQHKGVPDYLSSVPNSPLGCGYERKELHITKIHQESEETTDLPDIPDQSSSDELPEGVRSMPPSWMQLGIAELLFCLAILLLIGICVWLLSTGRLKPAQVD